MTDYTRWYAQTRDRLKADMPEADARAIEKLMDREVRHNQWSQQDDRSGPPWRCSGYFRQRRPAISRFIARFASRQQGTGRTNCRLADVLSSAARARRGCVHGQQCDISGGFVVDSIRLLLQQRWPTEQALAERNFQNRTLYHGDGSVRI